MAQAQPFLNLIALQLPYVHAYAYGRFNATWEHSYLFTVSVAKAQNWLSREIDPHDQYRVADRG